MLENLLFFFLLALGITAVGVLGAILIGLTLMFGCGGSGD